MLLRKFFLSNFQIVAYTWMNNFYMDTRTILENITWSVYLLTETEILAFMLEWLRPKKITFKGWLQKIYLTHKTSHDLWSRALTYLAMSSAIIDQQPWHLHCSYYVATKLGLRPELLVHINGIIMFNQLWKLFRNLISNSNDNKWPFI